MSLRSLGTLVDAQRHRRATPKGPTRLQAKMAEKKLTLVDEKTFRGEVHKRDGLYCRCCGRKVIVTIAHVPERREVHHIHGRTGDLRFEVRAAVQICLACHQKVTGRVGQARLVIVATRTFTTRQGTFTDATYPVLFKEVA